MKIKQTILAILSIAVIGVFITGQGVLAAEKCGNVTLQDGQQCCDGVATSIISCNTGGNKDDIENSGVWQLLELAINIMTAGIGILAAGGIIYASFIYTTASGSTEKTKKAIEMIIEIVIGIIAYALMYSFLNFLIPGGLFS